MVVGIRILYCFFAITLLSSCAGYTPVDTGKPYKPRSDVLDDLIGQTREVVVEKLGIPEGQFALDDRQFMLYFASATSTYRPAVQFIIPIPVPGDKLYETEVSCLMIKFGSNNLVKQYKFKNLHIREYESRDYGNKCLRRFFNKNELNMIYDEAPDVVEHSTVSQTITSYDMQAIMEEESESKWPLQAGDSVTITANKEISISSRKVRLITMNVVDANSTRIRGKIVFTPGDESQGYEDVTGQFVEVKLVDISYVVIWKKVERARFVKGDRDLDRDIGMILVVIMLFAL